MKTLLFFWYLNLQLILHGKSIEKEIQKLDEKLREVAVESSNFNTSVSSRPNGICCCIGDCCLVLVESAWGHIGSDGQIQHHQLDGPASVEVDIHEQVNNDYFFSFLSRICVV